MYNFKLFLIIFIITTVIQGNFANCPETNGPLTRLGSTRFYVAHPKERKDFVDWHQAKKLCEDNQMRMAEIKNMVTMAKISRELEEFVNKGQLKDTRYWLDATYDTNTDQYVWRENTSDPVEFSPLFSRKPRYIPCFGPSKTFKLPYRPTGVSGDLSWMGKYDVNSNKAQCLALVLPWPNQKEQTKTKQFFGYQTTIDERSCSSEKGHHAICESKEPDCEANPTSPFELTESQLDYFEEGNWIFGDRTYIINWKHRNFNTTTGYCTNLGLEVFEPSDREDHLIPYIKMWSRGITTAQAWTGLKYDAQTKTFLNSKGQNVKNAHHVEFKQRKIVKRSNRLDKLFCVAMSWNFEFPTQAPCKDPTSPDCHWSFIDYFPANCNNHLATICQHSDKAAREIKWDQKYPEDLQRALQETALTKEFGFNGNHRFLRSKFKQPFGVPFCPDGYRMLRMKTAKELGVQGTNQYEFPYDYLESYWVVDAEEFSKDENSMCTYVKFNGPPTSNTDAPREFLKTLCTDHKFYVCELVSAPLKPHASKPTESRKPEWTDGIFGRTYPLLNTGLSPPAVCQNVSKGGGKQRLELVFLLDVTTTMKQYNDPFKTATKQILHDLSVEYPGTKIGLSVFSNWPNGRVSGCYKFESKLSPTSIDIDAVNITFRFGRDQGSAAHASAFAVTDPKLGWTQGDTDPDGTLVKKFVIVITDANSLKKLPKLTGDEKPFSGNGTDNCYMSLPVDTIQLAKFLKDSNTNVIGFYSDSDHLKHHQNEWFGKTEATHCAETWAPPNSFINLTDVVKRCVGGVTTEVTLCETADPVGGYNVLAF